jgi:hypothetical protein
MSMKTVIGGAGFIIALSGVIFLYSGGGTKSVVSNDLHYESDLPPSHLRMMEIEIGDFTERKETQIIFDSDISNIYEEFGPGENRNKALQILFARSRLPLNDAFSYLQALDLDSEKRAARLGIAFRLGSERDMQVVADFLKANPELDVKDTSVISNGLAFMVDPEAVNRFMGMEGFIPGDQKGVPLKDALSLVLLLKDLEGEGGVSRVENFLKGVYGKRPFETFNVIIGDLIPEDEKTEGISAIKRYAISHMFAVDPSRALKEIDVFKNPKFDPKEFQFGMTSWIGMDMKKAHIWFEENRNEFPAEYLDAAFGSFVDVAGKANDFPAAREWLAEIQDEEVRANTSGELWKSERLEVISSAKNDPKGTLDDIISGHSDHEEFWIKESFSQWNSSEAESAFEWYEENRSVPFASTFELEPKICKGFPLVVGVHSDVPSVRA